MKPTTQQQQQSEQELAPSFSTQVLHAIIDEAVQPQLLLASGGVILYANRAFCAHAGCSAAEAHGQLLQSFQQGRWRPLALGLEGLLGTHPFGNGSHTVMGSTGYTFWCRPLPASSGQPHYLLSFTTNSTQPTTDAARAQKLANSLFEASPDCLKILDLNGHLQNMNSCGMALMEVDNFEPLRGAYWPGFWGAHQQLVEDALALARKGAIGKFAAPCPTVKGTPKHWEVVVAPAFGAGGEVLQLIASSRDITAEKATRTNLHRTEELARSLFDQSPDCLKLMDLEGRLIALNESGRQLLHTHGASKDLNWLDMWPAADKTTVVAAMQTAAAGSIGHFTAPCTMPSGHTFWWEVLLTPVRNELGAVYQIMAACRDITGRKALEQQLANSALQKELALQAASMGTWSFDFGSDDMGMDKRARELFGLEADQKISHADLFARIHPDDLPQLQETIETDILQHNSISHVEYRINPEIGANRWVHACRQMFFDDAGNPVHCVGLFQDITQRKETELRLRKINQTLQLGIQVGKLAIAEVDYTTGQVMLSAEAAHLYGFAPGTRQVTRQQIHASFHPDDSDRIFQMMRECMDPAGPGFMDLEHRVLVPGGAVRWLNVRKQVFFTSGDPQATPHYAIIAAQDITGQKASAARIQESEARFKAIFNGAPVAIWEEDFSDGMTLIQTLQRQGVYNLHHYCSQHPEIVAAFLSRLQVRDVNEAAVRLFEAKSKAELIERLNETFLPETREVFVRELVALASGQDYFRGEVRMQTLNGTPVWVLLSVRFPQGTSFSSVLVTMTDITVQKKLEAEVGANAGRIQQILDALPQKAWIAGPDGTMEYFSQQWYAYTGLRPNQSLGTSWQQALHPQDVQKLHSAIVLAGANQHNWETQVRLRNKEGQYRWHLTRALALKDETGAVTSWVGTNTDIHDQRTATDLLEQAVAERTQALQTTNKALQQTNKELEEFLYVASHDLQEPVRKIRTFANLVLERGQDSLSPQLTHYLQRIEASAQRMTSLIKSLLDFSSLRAHLPPAACNLTEVVENAVKELHWFVAQENAEITVQPLPVIVGVPHEVKQLFYNLVANALKFRSQDAPPVITIAAKPLQPAELTALGLPNVHYAHIEVADNGIGFQPQYSEKIFEMFQRLHNRSLYDGAGMGLALCRKIATKLGGHIWAEAGEGAGARFHVVLPLADDGA